MYLKERDECFIPNISFFSDLELDQRSQMIAPVKQTRFYHQAKPEWYTIRSLVWIRKSMPILKAILFKALQRHRTARIRRIQLYISTVNAFGYFNVEQVWLRRCTGQNNCVQPQWCVQQVWPTVSFLKSKVSKN